MENLEFVDSDGNIIRTIGTPTSGGEGDVYNIEGDPNLVVKIYNDKKRNKKPTEYEKLIRKLKTMCDICDDTIMSKAGWPQRIIYKDNQPVGFIMNKIKYCNTFHLLADPIDRREYFSDNNWKYIFYVAYNLACAVNALHKKGVIIGDINESNFLIGNRTVAQKEGIFDFKDNGIVYAIDCDSFQIPINKKYFMCTVAKPEFLPPELVGANLHEVIRTVNHDNFGLAVLIFQLVMQGKHPYVGIGTPGDVTESISKGYFIFGNSAKLMGILPPDSSEMYSMYSKIYYSLNDEIRSLFEQAFSSDHNVIRPDAEMWINAIKKQIDDLVQCDKIENHFYDKDGECIWCKIKQEYGFKPWENTVGNNYSQIAYNFSNQNSSQTVAMQTNNTAAVQSSSNVSSQALYEDKAKFFQKWRYINGTLYLYSDYLYFKSNNNGQNCTTIIPINEIKEVKKHIEAIEIITLDEKSYYIIVSNKNSWIENIYALKNGESVSFPPIPEQNNQLFEWFATQIENVHNATSDGILAVIKYILKGVFKFAYRAMLRPMFVLGFYVELLQGFSPNISESSLMNYTLSLFMVIIVFAFISETKLKQPFRRIVFICIAVILSVIFAINSQGTNNNDNSKQKESISAPQINEISTNTQEDNQNKQAKQTVETNYPDNSPVFKLSVSRPIPSTENNKVSKIDTSINNQSKNKSVKSETKTNNNLANSQNKDTDVVKSKSQENNTSNLASSNKITPVKSASVQKEPTSVQNNTERSPEPLSSYAPTSIGYKNIAERNMHEREKIVAIYDKHSPAYGYRYVIYAPIKNYVGHRKMTQPSGNGYSYEPIPDGGEGSSTPCFKSIEEAKHYYYPQLY